MTGENITEILIDNELINKNCKKAIEKINNTQSSKLRFKDFANLKTFGKDKVSSMKRPVLEEKLDKNIIQKVNTEFTEEPDILCAMRWCVRGLSVDNAIRKVKTDLEN